MPTSQEECAQPVPSAEFKGLRRPPQTDYSQDRRPLGNTRGLLGTLAVNSRLVRSALSWQWVKRRLDECTVAQLSLRHHLPGHLNALISRDSGDNGNVKYVIPRGDSG